MSTTAFPLLQLPAVPLRQTLGGLNATELFELHQCSKKTMIHLRQFEKANKTFKMTVDFQRNWVEIAGVYRVFVEEIPENGYGDKEVKSRKFCDTQVPIVDNEEKEITSYWPVGQKLQGTKTVAENYIKALGLSIIEGLMIAPESPALEILEWVDKCNVKIGNFDLMGTNPEKADELAQRIFSDDFLKKCTGNSKILLQPSENFSPQNFKMCNLNMLHLHNSQWINGQLLKAFNCKSSIFYHSTLKNADLKEFLGLWKDGSYSKMMRMSINTEQGNEFNLASIVDALGEIQEAPAAGQELATIKREDGTTAEVYLKDSRKHLEIDFQC